MSHYKKRKYNPYDTAHVDTVGSDYEISRKLSVLTTKVEALAAKIYKTGNAFLDLENAQRDHDSDVDSLFYSLLRIGELAKLLSDNFRIYYNDMRKIVNLGMFITNRNILAHCDTEDVNPTVIYYVSTLHIQKLNEALADFQKYCVTRNDVSANSSPQAFFTRDRMYDTYIDYLKADDHDSEVKSKLLKAPDFVLAFLRHKFAMKRLDAYSDPYRVITRLGKMTGQQIFESQGIDEQFDENNVDHIRHAQRLLSRMSFVIEYDDGYFWALRK